ncbi:beta-1,3-galactosyltransferase 6 [Bombus vancouverensis nearcticus]|uniref:Hexosyltransferase n=1 Tax=Bombus bifarius TaxID=103933 RepID=A0A6P8N7V1_9HYME|nr:beta-1,3-galactosyltransferase 6 isoform X1 [Bombus vancouverensis nearcticus]XP_033198510.1 beta-1,3-galactosyltransferase 6 isoform X2 [Bombus vancouverensis nearcticus]XP_033316529.1 beta-1,3-galactosyltransferase 6 isoform X1 [Bombus bifarius]XP_033316530.1 beta-1,3-galactosyltransferase 6 isoform X2 [Bombus bifarius]
MNSVTLLPLKLSSKNLFMMIRKKLHVKFNIPTLLIILLIVFLCIRYLPSTKCSLNEQEVRNKTKFRLMVLILSNPDNLERRATIRKTWLAQKQATVKHFFVIGTLDILSEQRKTLHSEQQKFDDLLLLSRLPDSYGTLTKKVLHAFKEIYEYYEFDFVMKCDDDTFALVHKILKELDKWDSKGTKKELYWGFFNGKAHVKRSGPWKETDWILCDYYLPYALGGGYILSYNLVKFIAINADIFKLYKAEDVSVGVWIAPLANIERKHDIRFNTEYRSRGCSNQYIVTHKQTIENMKNMHEYYQASGALCMKEIRNHMSYQYNWTVPPSQCCNLQPGIP